MKIDMFTYKFIDEIPPVLVDGTVYVSTPYATALHLCACGCGIKVVTPLSPRDWYVVFNGSSVSLSPSIGNWSFPCRSHYWIRKGRVEWSDRWSDQKIQANREADRATKERTSNSPVKTDSVAAKATLFDRISGWVRSRGQ